MPTEEQIPIKRRGKRVDQGGHDSTPKPSVTDDGIKLHVPQPPQPKKPKKTKVRRGMIS